MIRRITVHVWAPKTNKSIRGQYSDQFPPVVINNIAQFVPQPNPSALVKAPADKTYKTTGLSMNSKTEKKLKMLNPDAPEFALENITSSNTTTTNARLIRSEPPSHLVSDQTQNAIKPTLAPVVDQIKNNSPNKPEPDNNDYKNWTHCDVGDNEYKLMVDECSTDEFRGVWWFSGPKQQKRTDDSELMWYVAESNKDSQAIFENGAHPDEEVMVLCEKLKDALIDYDPEPDENGYIRIFHCNVYLNEALRKNFDQYHNVSILENARECVEFLVCAQVKKETLLKTVED
jgi:hypothetical protein